MGIAVPPMPTSEVVSTPAGPTDQLGRQLAEVITGDLKNSGLFKPLAAGQLLAVPLRAGDRRPIMASWSSAGATALVQGYVRANGNGTLTVGCYLYDTAAQRELARQGYVVPFGEWRRAAHKCADMVYTRLTGEGPYFDSRVVYVSETGPKGKRIKRLALMDQDGFNGRFLTNGQTIVLTPTLSRDQRRIAYLSYLDKKPTIYVYDIASGQQSKLVDRCQPGVRAALLARRPVDPVLDGAGRQYRPLPHPVGRRAVAAADRHRRGSTPAAAIRPTATRIVFESDRSGAQQLYVMNADGSNQQRISFGNGRYATPAWSPRGDLIAFTKIGGGFHVGIMSPGGGGEKMLTDGWQDEAPSWSPNGRVHDVLPLDSGRVGRGGPVVGRPDRGQRAPLAHAVRRIGPELGPDPQPIDRFETPVRRSNRQWQRTTTKLILLAALVATAGCAQQAAQDPAAGRWRRADRPTMPGNNGGGIVVPGSAQDFQRSVMSDTIHFALDKYDIDATSRSILDSQAAWLTKWPDRRITIEGHADERGTREYNLALGDRRANAAKNYLAATRHQRRRGSPRSAMARNARSRWDRTRRAGRRTAAR